MIVTRYTTFCDAQLHHSRYPEARDARRHAQTLNETHCLEQCREHGYVALLVDVDYGATVAVGDPHPVARA